MIHNVKLRYNYKKTHVPAVSSEDKSKNKSWFK